MGKRELIIIGAFVVVAAVVYQFTAPAPKPGERSFSLSRIFSGIKREMTADSKSASMTRTGTLALDPGVTELRLTAIRAVPLTVVGERREDIGYELFVESTGPDDATAREYANRSVLFEDDLGEARVLGIKFPEEGQQTGRLTLRVPERLQIRFENSGRVDVSAVRAVELRNLGGDTTITDVQAQVAGSHRSGELIVSAAGTVELALSSSRAKFTGIAGAVSLKGRSGDCAIVQPRGPVEIEMLSVDVSITEPANTVRVSGDNGTLKLVSPAKSFNIDVRRMLVEITLAAAVPGTAITTDEPLRLSLVGPPGVTIDAATIERGAVRATELGLTPTDAPRESRLTAPVGGGGPRLLLRNTRADIVIALRK